MTTPLTRARGSAFTGFRAILGVLLGSRGHGVLSAQHDVAGLPREDRIQLEAAELIDHLRAEIAARDR